MADKRKMQEEFEAYFKEKNRKPRYVKAAKPDSFSPAVEEVQPRNLAIRILKSIGVGFVFFIAFVPALPWVAGIWFVVTLFGSMLMPHFPAIIWVPFSIIVFISPFLIGFVVEFFDLLDN